MPELRGTFRSVGEWQDWWGGVPRPKEVRDQIVEAVRAHGLREPFTGVHRKPHEILIDPDNLHETIRVDELNARKRALLAQYQLELRATGMLNNRRLRTLSADGVSRMARILRGIFPYFLGTEYLPSEAARAHFFPIPHLDLQEIGFAEASFDTFFSGDVFEHVPDLDRALREIARVLRPGGLLVSSFPFTPTRTATLVKASLSEAGEVVHHAPPEYHGNPADPEAGSLVFSYPGWDILDRLRDVGFEDARFNFIGSSKFGICANGLPGAFVLSATRQRTGDGKPPAPVPTPRPIRFTGEWPDGFYAILGSPRSGTTLITSLFAVHSRFEAVYEPWNAKTLAVEDVPTLEGMIAASATGSLAGRNLVVKETTADLRYAQRLRQLYRSVPEPVQRRFIVILRRPISTLLSEYRRRNEWWGAQIDLDEAFYERWSSRSEASLNFFLEFAREAGGTFVALESLAADPGRVLSALADRTGFTVEERQLNYERHVDRSRVRGDINLSQAPKAISAEAVTADAEQVALVEAIAERSGGKGLLDRAEALHDHLVGAGGVASFAELPASLGGGAGG